VQPPSPIYLESIHRPKPVHSRTILSSSHPSLREDFESKPASAMAQQSNMLAVFSQAVAHCPAGAQQASSLRGEEVLTMFGKANENTVSIYFGDAVALRYNNCCGQR